MTNTARSRTADEYRQKLTDALPLLPRSAVAQPSPHWDRLQDNLLH